MSKTAPYEIGAARTQIGAPLDGTGMMGWANLRNVVCGSRTPLYTRAFVLHRGDSRTALVCLELAFVTIAVKQGVVARLERDHADLRIGEANLLICATHTHSAHGGFSHYPLYNITIPGHVPQHVEQIVDAIVRAIVAATRQSRPGRARFVEGEVDESCKVAFNRSVSSYNLNDDVDSVPAEAAAQALDRTMRLLRFEDLEGRLIGSINWFAVHATNVHSDNRLAHFDNKGYAAQMLEAGVGPGFVGAFAQGAAGDVTPNFIRDAKKHWVRGIDPDDDRSARENGRLQYEQAAKLHARADRELELDGPLDHVLEYVDFSQIEVDPKYARGRAGRRTGPGEIGWAMLFGTEEGPGLPRRLLLTQELAQRARQRLRGGSRRREIQGDKLTVIETGRRRFFGARRFPHLSPASRLPPALAQLLALDQSNRRDTKPWTPQVLPLQLIRIGPLAIAAIPTEATTVAGRRLRSSIAEALRDSGIEKVVLSGYSNAYAGYLTTPEEYARQDYEGASTHFGVWTLGGYQTRFDGLATMLGNPDSIKHPSSLRPPEFSEDDLANRLFKSLLG